jgi:hypothetical protein
MHSAVAPGFVTRTVPSDLYLVLTYDPLISVGDALYMVERNAVSGRREQVDYTEDAIRHFAQRRLLCPDMLADLERMRRHRVVLQKRIGRNHAATILL